MIWGTSDALQGFLRKQTITFTRLFIGQGIRKRTVLWSAQNWSLFAQKQKFEKHSAVPRQQTFMGVCYGVHLKKQPGSLPEANPFQSNVSFLLALQLFSHKLFGEQQKTKYKIPNLRSNLIIFFRKLWKICLVDQDSTSHFYSFSLKKQASKQG